ncbi:hypothetical protein EVAR_14864_1 [Eumeta japonica]|uniref:Uncharacterized protein n=1 Tax=Eumeta variegata TaxID=151549 RepID=A0A4C1V2Y7_EUMVA|nr:hypothetical protein EVAR_14864_1 [Eumeta japonica]
MGDAWRKSSRHRMSQETVTGRFPSLLPGRRRLSTAAVRASGGSVSTFRGLRIGGWDAAVDSQPPRESALGCDPAMSKNRFDASFIYLDIVESSKSLWRIELRHTNVNPLRLYRIYSVLPVVYVVLPGGVRRRETRMSSPS